MMKTTLKDIKDFFATDITNYGFNDMESLAKTEGFFYNIAYSTGVYGMTGIVVQGDKTKTLYKITRRTTALFMV